MAFFGVIGRCGCDTRNHLSALPRRAGPQPRAAMPACTVRRDPQARKYGPGGAGVPGGAACDPAFRFGRGGSAFTYPVTCLMSCSCDVPFGWVEHKTILANLVPWGHA